ncbi:hypothetical protein EIN_380320 [Entamoeba invadens IP1]|uniref:U1-C C2H2-type zinc finger domain-containing protein n=1 Tax=Entamoeba invadens IP1 TaxID=370355 RepID=A0A0A1UAV0_ENTIV|nr:hypothetical protein EIN_380320 [Entamoeba invadens IP1]ELP92115.1 hypothetical protein EIN_380320 [Entamoeba invadens IP1]|eukprot:XP_004258886.1 hypothetical protein EIN_380320 [Entamoeba invadens IP1]
MSDKQQMYWCKFCKKFIQNKAVTRQQHESSGSHKRCMQKFLEEEKRAEARKDKREFDLLNDISKMEQAAVKQMGQDIEHNAIREKVITKDTGIRESLNDIRKKREDSKKQERAARSYYFETIRQTPDYTTSSARDY